MKTKILRFSLIAVACLSLSLAAQAQRTDSPVNIEVLPDLQVKSVKVEWFEIKGRGFYLQVTPTIQKNKQDKIKTEDGKPVIILVNTSLKGITPGPSCKLEIFDWMREETERSFGTCTLKAEEYSPPIIGNVHVDNEKQITELNENNNSYNLKIPPKPSN